MIINLDKVPVAGQEQIDDFNTIKDITKEAFQTLFQTRITQFHSHYPIYIQIELKI